MAAGGRLRAEARDRIVLVAGDEEAAALEAELGFSPEKPAALAVRLTLAEARDTGRGEHPLVLAAADATVVVLDRDAQQDDSVVAQAAVMHEKGLRVRTLTAFYEEWLGKLPIAELERVSLLFDIGEVTRTRRSE